jgi:S1-C subfamily serine protease
MGIPEQLPHPYVQEVAVGSPAESAQMKSGDVVMKLNGIDVDSSQAFITKIQEFRGKRFQW